MISKTIFLVLVFAGVTIPRSEAFRLQVLAPPECPDDGSHFFPDPEDCSAYYHCSFGVPHHQRCPNGLYWNQAIQSCDAPENVECNLTPSSTTAREEETTSEGRTTSSSSAATTIFPTTPASRCPPEGVISIPIEGGNCKEYILCVEGREYIRQCPAGTLFDPIELTCKREEEVDCGQRTTPRPSPTTSNPETTPGNPETSPDSTLNPETTPGRTTSKPETTPEPQPSSTTPEAELPTTSPNPGDFNCPANVPFIYMPHPQSCNLFYWCEYGVYKGTSNCGTDLWFSFLNQACVDPWESECKETRPMIKTPFFKNRKH